MFLKSTLYKVHLILNAVSWNPFLIKSLSIVNLYIEEVDSNKKNTDIANLLHRVDPFFNIKPKFLAESSQAGCLSTTFNENEFKTLKFCFYNACGSS